MPQPAAVPPEPAVVSAYRLTAPHGYVETRFNRGVFSWRAGEVITDPEEIAHLQKRGAAMEPVEP